MRSTSGSPGISALLESNLPKPHIQQLHLRIHQAIAFEASPRFLQAVVVLLVEVDEPEDGRHAVFPRRHLVCRNAILKESVVRGHACKQQDTQDVVSARNRKMIDKPATYAARRAGGDSPLTELPNHHSKSKEAEHGRHEHHHEHH